MTHDLPAESDDTPVSREVATARLARQIAGRYRISAADAIAAVEELLAEDRAFMLELDRAGVAGETIGRFARRRVFKLASKRIKEAIYADLRQYRRDDQDVALLSRLAALDGPLDPAPLAEVATEIARHHVSTAERLDNLSSLMEAIGGHLRGGVTVLDVGSGVFPVLLPLSEESAGISQVWAIDRDRWAIEVLEHYARLRGDDWIRPLLWDIAHDWEPLHQQGLPREIDVALILKVVPVVQRHNRALLDVLARVPARRIVVTGSRVAMAKRESIDRRETRVLRTFLEDHGLDILDEFRTEDEVGFLSCRTD